MSSSDDDIEFIAEKKSTKKEEVVCDDSEDNNETIDEVEAIGQPSGAECLSRCKQFAEITGTDTALAMFYLQDTNWDLEKGLNSFYQTTKDTKSKIVACFDLGKLDQDENLKRSDLNGKSSKSTDSTDSSSLEEVDNVSQVDTSDDKFFKIMSWNIDGLDKKNLESRTTGVISKIINEKPDVIFFQEVVYQSEIMLKDSLQCFYNFASGNQDETSRSLLGYFTMILTRKKTCTFKSKDITNFYTRMDRNLLKCHLTYKNKVDICAMTSHLESTASSAQTRMEQLQKCFKEALEQNPEEVVYFGGDLNIRDSEISGIGGTPKGLYDMWESTGSRKECLYTWDCSRNSNLTMNGKFKPKLRFDRLYYRPIISDKPEFTLMPVYFELEGLEKLKSCGRFCSDHWAIQSYCQIEANKAC